MKNPEVGAISMEYEYLYTSAIAYTGAICGMFSSFAVFIFYMICRLTISNRRLHAMLWSWSSVLYDDVV